MIWYEAAGRRPRCFFCGKRGIKGKKGIGGRATARVAPTERFVGAEDPVRPAPITRNLVGQGPCALSGVRHKVGRADVGIGPYGGLQEVRWGGRPRGSPLRKKASLA